jgi:hypothetical protein
MPLCRYELSQLPSYFLAHSTELMAYSLPEAEASHSTSTPHMHFHCANAEWVRRLGVQEYGACLTAWWLVVVVVVVGVCLSPKAPD